MNLNMIKPKNETEDLLLLITENCERLIKQTHTKTQETLEFKLIRPRQTFHFNPNMPIGGFWMLELTIIEVQNSIFNTTEENSKFELCKLADEKSGGVSYEEIRDENEKELEITDITATDLQDDVIGPIIIEEYRNQSTKRTKDDKNRRFFRNLC